MQKYQYFMIVIFNLEETKFFKWKQSKEVVRLDLLQVEGDLSDKDTLLIYYTTERIDDLWTTVVHVEGGYSEEKRFVLCESQSKSKCMPSAMNFHPYISNLFI